MSEENEKILENIIRGLDKALEILMDVGDNVNALNKNVHNPRDPREAVLPGLDAIRRALEKTNNIYEVLDQIHDYLEFFYLLETLIVGGN